MRRLLSILIAALLLASCKNGHVLDIRSFRLPADKPFTVGGKGDIILPGLPDTVLEISYNNGLQWKMRHPVYLKLNNETVNRVKIDSISAIRIMSHVITKEQLTDCTKKFSDKDYVAYIALKDILANYYPSANLSVQSIFACDKDVKCDNTAGYYHHHNYFRPPGGQMAKYRPAARHTCRINLFQNLSLHTCQLYRYR